jgi:diacylglycerol kinase (ATP)
MPKLKSIHKQGGLRRLVSALGHSCRGLKHGLAHDPAIRQVTIVVGVLAPLSFLLPVGVIEHLILVLSLLLVLLVEFLNSAIEAVVDRISTEHHPLSGHAKDLGSVAVGLAAVMSALCWVVIGGPVLLSWLRK